jgi:hypothetical protein
VSELCPNEYDGLFSMLLKELMLAVCDTGNSRSIQVGGGSGRYRFGGPGPEGLSFALVDYES